MKRNDIIIISASVVIVMLILGYYFLYNIYETEVELNPKYLYADTNSIIEIKVIPINALGTRAIFRSIISEFEIIEGKELVEIISTNNGLLKLKSKGLKGKVGIKIYSKHSLFPQYIEIPILPLQV